MIEVVTEDQLFWNKEKNWNSLIIKQTVTYGNINN